MGCSCKGNNSETQKPQTTTQNQTTNQNTVMESLATKVKKTVEKYYNTNKTN
jgi:hypothetical protein